MFAPLFVPPWDKLGKMYYPLPYTFSLDSFQVERAKWKIVMDNQIRKQGQIMMGVPNNRWEPHLSYPQMLWMKDPVKHKRVAPLAAPTAIPLGDYLDTAFAEQLHEEEQMVGAVWKGKDPKSLCTAQMLVVAKEESLGVNVATVTIMEYELPIAIQMKKKRRQTTAEHLSYMASLEMVEEETP